MNETFKEPRILRYWEAAIASVENALNAGLPNFDNVEKAKPGTRRGRMIDSTVKAMEAWETKWREAIGDKLEAGKYGQDDASLLGVIYRPPDATNGEPHVLGLRPDYLLPDLPKQRKAPNPKTNWADYAEFQRQCVDARRAWALRLCKWCKKQIQDYRDARLPKVSWTAGEKKRRHEATISWAGSVRPGTITTLNGLTLKNLKSRGWHVFRNTEEKRRFLHDVPELESSLIRKAAGKNVLRFGISLAQRRRIHPPSANQ